MLKLATISKGVATLDYFVERSSYRNMAGIRNRTNQNTIYLSFKLICRITGYVIPYILLIIYLYLFIYLFCLDIYLYVKFGSINTKLRIAHCPDD